jgi:hypothetical protein
VALTMSAATWCYGDFNGCDVSGSGGVGGAIVAHGAQVFFAWTWMSPFGKSIPIADARRMVRGKVLLGRRLAAVRRRGDRTCDLGW